MYEMPWVRTHTALQYHGREVWPELEGPERKIIVKINLPEILSYFIKVPFIPSFQHGSLI